MPDRFRIGRGRSRSRLGRQRAGFLPRTAFTLLELLVALAIAMTFLGALYTSLIGMLTALDEAAARMEALRNGRAALQTLSNEIKMIGRSGSEFLVVGLNRTAAFGNGINEDEDDETDEEVLDGRDDDALTPDWSAPADELHAQIGTIDPVFERYAYTTLGGFGALFGAEADDHGDLHVDEDVRFGLDSIVFRIPPTSPIEGFLLRRITYTIGSFDGERHVLIRQSRTEFTDRPPVETTAPIAFGVLGFDVLYWDPNADPDPGVPRDDRPGYVESWDSTEVDGFDSPMLPLPASILVRVTLHADRTGIEGYNDGDVVRTIHLQTVINIEETIGDALYPRPTI